MLGRLLSVLVCSLVVASATQAQVAPPPPVSGVGASQSAASSSVTTSVLYRLTDAAGFEEGCFPPCMCPIFYTEDLRGTLKLSPAPGWSIAVQVWTISEVNWYYSWGEGWKRVVGSGTYTRTTLPGAPPTHRLVMDLKVDDEAVERYDSGNQAWLSPNPSVLPRFDLVISKNGLFCYDRAFRVAVEAAPASAVTRYSVAGTRYLEGCFPPCLCPIMFNVDVRGTLDLVELGQERGFQGWGVVNARWTDAPSPTPTLKVRATGYGVYRTGSPGPLPVVQEQMIMDVVVNGFSARMEAPWEPVSAPWPAVEIDISDNGFFCYDRAFEVRAHPAP